MEALFDIGRLILGGLVLYLGAEWLVKGSAGLARAFGVKPLVVGLTVVAYGTSAPELAVSSAAILKGSSDIVNGNVIGSCVANLALILGVTALIAPPRVDPRLIRREIPILLVSVSAVPLIYLDGKISVVEAIVLLVVSIVFTVVTLTASSADDGSSAPVEETSEVAETVGNESKLMLIAITVVGLGLLVGGGDWFVRGAKGLAKAFGMSELMIGQTVVAVGTSLPELAASVVAAARGYTQLAVGNVIGSNIFNVFLIYGVVGQIDTVYGSISGLALPLAFLVGVTLLGVLFMRGDRLISRVEGLVLLGAYSAYIVSAAIVG